MTEESGSDHTFLTALGRLPARRKRRVGLRKGQLGRDSRVFCRKPSFPPRWTAEVQYLRLRARESARECALPRSLFVSATWAGERAALASNAANVSFRVGFPWLPVQTLPSDF